MISTVTLLGQASDRIQGYGNTFRYIDLQTLEPFDENTFLSKIPVMYWDRSEHNPLMNIPNGHLVVIFGRIESHPELGLFVLGEQVRHFPSNLKIHQQQNQPAQMLDEEVGTEKKKRRGRKKLDLEDLEEEEM